ncbi:unnamed protein product [Closterium sp. NIES-53]
MGFVASQRLWARYYSQEPLNKGVRIAGNSSCRAVGGRDFELRAALPSQPLVTRGVSKTARTEYARSKALHLAATARLSADSQRGALMHIYVVAGLTGNTHSPHRPRLLPPLVTTCRASLVTTTSTTTSSSMGGFKAAAALLVVAILIASEVGVSLGAPAAKGTTAGGGIDSAGITRGASEATTIGRRLLSRLTGGRGRSATGVPVYAERRDSDSTGATTGASKMTDRGASETWVTSAKGVPVYAERHGSDSTGATTGASETWVPSAATSRPAARETVPAEVRVGSVVLLGSLAQPRSVSFDSARCVSVPEVGGTTNGSAVDALVWWDVFSERTICNAVQLFASPDCSGTAAAKHLLEGYMSAPIPIMPPCAPPHAPTTPPSPLAFPCPPLPPPVHACEQCHQDERISEVHPLRSQQHLSPCQVP